MSHFITVQTQIYQIIDSWSVYLRNVGYFIGIYSRGDYPYTLSSDYEKRNGENFLDIKSQRRENDE